MEQRSALTQISKFGTSSMKRACSASISQEGDGYEEDEDLPRRILKNPFSNIP